MSESHVFATNPRSLTAPKSWKCSRHTRLGLDFGMLGFSQAGKVTYTTWLNLKCLREIPYPSLPLRPGNALGTRAWVRILGRWASYMLGK